jgi:hypothetical protein
MCILPSMSYLCLFLHFNRRIPLNSLTMAIDVLRGSVPDSDKKTSELINTMECSSSFMEHALNSYITVQQIEENNFELKENVIDLETFFSDAIRKLSTTLRDKHNVKLVTNVPSSFPSQIIGDEKQLKYILNNVVMHAARLTKDEIKIEVMGGFRKEGSGEKKFEISVCIVGNGERIADFEKELFFSPYGMLFTGKIDKDNVEGLSLLISKEIIKLYGGLMTVFSRDEGTVYSFQIPFETPLTQEQELKKKETESKANLLKLLSDESGVSAMFPRKEEAPAAAAAAAAAEHTSQESTPGGSKSTSNLFGRHGIETPLNALRLSDGTMYFQPRLNKSSCDSLVFNLNELDKTPKKATVSSESDFRKSSGAGEKDTSGSSLDADVGSGDDYGLYCFEGDGEGEGEKEGEGAVEGSSDHYPPPAPPQPPSPPLPPAPREDKETDKQPMDKPENRVDEKLKQMDQHGENFSDLNVLVVDGESVPKNYVMNPQTYLLSLLIDF